MRFSRTVVFCFALIFIPHICDAAITLRANPVRGGNSLRFGRVSGPGGAAQEVRLRVSSSEGKQYQIYQRIENSFTNERGETLQPRAVKTSTVAGSNASGTRYVQSLENLGFTDQLLFTSDQAGSPDTLTVLYQVQGDKIDSAGTYFGRILYRVRALGSGAQDEAFLNVYIDAQGELKAEVESSSGSDTLRLTIESNKTREDYARISFSGNMGRDIRIYQEVRDIPVNDAFEELDPAVVRVQTSGGRNGELYGADISELSLRRELLYSSTANEDEIVVSFFPDSPEGLEETAGLYRGTVVYTIETGTRTIEKEIDLEVDIASVFDIEIELPPGGVSFERLLPISPPKRSVVKVKVTSNTGQPYIVAQKVSLPLSSEKGDRIAKPYFTMKGELEDKKTGRVAFDEFRPVEDESTPIFYSDGKGSSSQFRVIYQLKPYSKMQPGDYRASIVYSLEEK